MKIYMACIAYHADMAAIPTKESMLFMNTRVFDIEDSEEIELERSNVEQTFNKIIREMSRETYDKLTKIITESAGKIGFDLEQAREESLKEIRDIMDAGMDVPISTPFDDEWVSSFARKMQNINYIDIRLTKTDYDLIINITDQEYMFEYLRNKYLSFYRIIVAKCKNFDNKNINTLLISPDVCFFKSAIGVISLIDLDFNRTTDYNIKSESTIKGICKLAEYTLTLTEECTDECITDAYDINNNMEILAYIYPIQYDMDSIPMPSCDPIILSITDNYGNMPNGYKFKINITKDGLNETRAVYKDYFINGSNTAVVLQKYKDQYFMSIEDIL